MASHSSGPQLEVRNLSLLLAPLVREASISENLIGGDEVDWQILKGTVAIRDTINN